MGYQDAAGQISLLTALCFSFCIVFLSLFIHNSPALSRLLGIAFFAAFLANAAALLTEDRYLKLSVSQAGYPVLLILVFMLLVSKPGKKYFKIYGSVLIAFPSIVLILILSLSTLRIWFSEPSRSLMPVIALLLLNLYVLKAEKGSKSMLFWAVLVMGAAETAYAFIPAGPAEFVWPLLLLASYFMFMRFFYHELVRSLQRKVSEAEKQLGTINRSMDYEVRKRVAEIERVNRNLVKMSRTDPLTKVYNKASIVDAIDNAIMQKPDHEFSLLMFDIDEFKVINDTLGHSAGDKCLKALAVTAKNNMREFDLIGRYGGDEFIVMLPGTNLNQALLIAERFRKSVFQSESPHYTISIGISTYPGDGRTVKELIEAADDGLYVSKGKGRNAVSYKNIY